VVDLSVEHSGPVRTLFKRIRSALISFVVFRAFGKAQAVWLMTSVLDLATKSLYALISVVVFSAFSDAHTDSATT
jgi:hypothetical protein